MDNVVVGTIWTTSVWLQKWKVSLKTTISVGRQLLSFHMCACLCFQNGEEFDIQVLSSSAIYRPSKTVVDNLQQRNFLGQAKVSCNWNKSTRQHLENVIPNVYFIIWWNFYLFDWCLMLIFRFNIGWSQALWWGEKPADDPQIAEGPFQLNRYV